jgi:hypothetical protein
LSEKERTINVSLRISESAYRALQEDSKKRNVSLNTFANQIFLAYAEYDRHLRKFGMLKISRPTFARIIDEMQDDAASEAGRKAGAETTPSVILSTEGEITATTVSGWMKRIGTYSGLFDYAEITHGGKVTITLSHNLGQKWSLILAGYAEELYKAARIQIKVKWFPDAVTFEI